MSEAEDFVSPNEEFYKSLQKIFYCDFMIGRKVYQLQNDKVIECKS